VISREELVAAEAAFVSSSVLRAFIDLSELPDDDSWDTWVYSEPLSYQMARSR
jgi:hypothetical protein